MDFFLEIAGLGRGIRNRAVFENFRNPGVKPLAEFLVPELFRNLGPQQFALPLAQWTFHFRSFCHACRLAGIRLPDCPTALLNAEVVNRAVTDAMQLSEMAHNKACPDARGNPVVGESWQGQ